MIIQHCLLTVHNRSLFRKQHEVSNVTGSLSAARQPKQNMCASIQWRMPATHWTHLRVLKFSQQHSSGMSCSLLGEWFLTYQRTVLDCLTLDNKSIMALHNTGNCSSSDTESHPRIFKCISVSCWRIASQTRLTWCWHHTVATNIASVKTD